MNQEYLFHHSYIESERTRQRAEDFRTYLLAGFVVVMFLAGFAVGYLCAITPRCLAS